jgi:hypothetical protein
MEWNCLYIYHITLYVVAAQKNIVSTLTPPTQISVKYISFVLYIPENN